MRACAALCLQLATALLLALQMPCAGWAAALALLLLCSISPVLGAAEPNATWCWGSGAGGRLGNGALNASAIPVQVAGDQSFASVVVGNMGTSCGLTPAGEAFCWVRRLCAGLQPAVGSLAHVCCSLAMRPVPDLVALALQGEGSTGQLGNGAFNSSSTPVRVAGGITFASLFISDYHACGIDTARMAHCWVSVKRLPCCSLCRLAYLLALACLLEPTHSNPPLVPMQGRNRDYELGGPSPDSAANSSVPVAVGGGNLFTQLALGVGWTCGLNPVGQALCWGRWEQLGNSVIQTNTMSTMEVEGGHIFRSLLTGDGFTCGLDSKSKAWCWASGCGARHAPACCTFVNLHGCILSAACICLRSSAD